MKSDFFFSKTKDIFEDLRITQVAGKGRYFKTLPYCQKFCSSNPCKSMMKLKLDLNFLRSFVSSNLSSPYKIKPIRLLCYTVEKKIGIFSQSFIRVPRFEL